MRLPFVYFLFFICCLLLLLLAESHILYSHFHFIYSSKLKIKLCVCNILNINIIQKFVWIVYVLEIYKFSHKTYKFIFAINYKKKVYVFVIDNVSNISIILHSHKRGSLQHAMLIDWIVMGIDFLQPHTREWSYSSEFRWSVRWWEWRNAIVSLLFQRT